MKNKERIKNLTDSTKNLAMELGADLVAVASGERFHMAPPGYRPTDLLPEAKAVITYAVSALRGTFMSPQFRIYQMSYPLLRGYCNDLSFKVAHSLEREGYPSIMIPSTFPVDMVEKKGLMGDFSHKHAAEIAGLGEIGLINILVTNPYGPRVWLGSVITTAPLVEDPQVGEKRERICIEGCNLCADACPVGAISKKGIDKKKCVARGVHSGNLSGLIQHIKEVMALEDTEERQRKAFGPKAWELYQSMVMGTIPHCDKCLRACPVGT